MRSIYLHFIVLIMLSHQLKAQQRSKNLKPVKHSYTKIIRTEISPYSLTLRGGLTQFFGELNEQDMQAAFGVSLGRNIRRSISVNLDYSAGKLGGQKAELFNSYFINEYNTAEVLTKWNLTEQWSRNKLRLNDICIYGGVGLMLFSANAYDMMTNEKVRFSNSKSSKRNQLFLRWGNPRGRAGIKKTHERVIPVGTSLNYLLSKKWQIGLDYRFYFIRTDKADATSGQRLINPEEQDSYSTTPNDKFSVLSVSLTHCFVKVRKH